MPTGARLTGGLCVAVTHLLVILLIGIADQEIALGLVYLGAAVGLAFLIGWRVMGAVGPGGLVASFFGAIRSGLYAFICTALVLGAAEFSRALGRVNFNDLMDPILFWLEASVTVARGMLTVQLGGVMLAGMAVCWILTWIVARAAR